MNNLYVESFLPEGLLKQFDIVSIAELGQVKYKRVNFYIYLDEKNILPAGYDINDYESKGFLMESIFKIFQFVVKQFIWLYEGEDGDTNWNLI